MPEANKRSRWARVSDAIVPRVFVQSILAVNLFQTVVNVARNESENTL